MRKTGIGLALLATLCSAGALAQEGLGPGSEATVPGPEEQQLTLPGGKLFLDAFLEVSLSKDAAFKPVSLAPDLWYGINDDLTLGLVHSGRGATGIFGTYGNGLCFTGKSNGCANPSGTSKVYNHVGVDARYQLLRKTGISVAGDGGLYVNYFDPFQLALKLGAVGRFHTGAVSVELDPSLFFGMTKRSAGNKEVLTVPATFMYAVTPKVGVAAQLALSLPFQTTELTMFGLSVGVQYFITDQLILDAVFSLPAMFGGSAVPDGVDMRALTLGVAYAF